LAIRVDWRLSRIDVIETLPDASLVRAVTEDIRSANWSEFVALASRKRLLGLGASAHANTI